ncbi:MAG: hypothetical protein WC755_04580, partial [Candidatus Woesearchaeota archaeon]
SAIELYQFIKDNYNSNVVLVADTNFEVTPSTMNAIIYGSPAVNRIAAELIGVTYPAYGLASGLFEGEGEAVIKLVQDSDYSNVLIAGWAKEDDNRAVNVLMNFDQYEGQLQGYEVKITGTITPPVIQTPLAKTSVAKPTSAMPSNPVPTQTAAVDEETAKQIADMKQEIADLKKKQEEQNNLIEKLMAFFQKFFKG